jgi:hypothetical protein
MTQHSVVVLHHSSRGIHTIKLFIAMPDLAMQPEGRRKQTGESQGFL